MTTGIVILAAGGSARLGQSKQRLLYKGKTLLETSVYAAIYSVCKPVIVVLGANADNNDFIGKSENVFIVQNESWQKGIGSSIRCGIKELLKIEPAVTDAIIMLCDQPYADTALLDKLVKTKLETGKQIVASAYNNSIGVPALFDKIFFPLLLQLKGKEGAKKIIFDNEAQVAAIPFPLGSIDIDTTEDYEKLISDK